MYLSNTYKKVGKKKLSSQRKIFRMFLKQKCHGSLVHPLDHMNNALRVRYSPPPNVQQKQLGAKDCPLHQAASFQSRPWPPAKRQLQKDDLVLKPTKVLWCLADPTDLCQLLDQPKGLRLGKGTKTIV